MIRSIRRCQVILSLVGVTLGAACASGAWAQSATFARSDYPLLGNSHIAVDLNGDGRLDLAGPGAASADVMLGNGDGTFQPKVSYPVGTWAQSLAAADFNGDGRADLAVTLNDQATSLAVLMGNGDGTFGVPRHYPNWSGADSPFVTATDTNNDGREDLVILHSMSAYTAPIVMSSSLSILLGNGDGTFQAPRELTVGTGMLRLAVGDFNRDGLKDFAITGDTARAYVLLAQSDGSYVQQTLTLVTQNPGGVDATDVGVADLNADGAQDLVFVIGLEGSRTAVLLGNGDGTFRTPTILAEPQLWTPQYQAIADYNRDGKLDIALGLGYGTTGIMDIWFGNGDGTFQGPVLYCPPVVVGGQGGGVVIAADFNGDGRPDIALQAVGSNPALIVLTNTTGAVAAPAGVLSLTLSPSSVVGGTNATGTVTLTTAVKVSTTVALSTASSAISLPSSVTVPAGGSSVRFTIGTRTVVANTTATVTASLNGTSKSGSLLVTPASPSNADTVSIGRAEYETAKQSLRLEATSTSSSATLSAYVTSTGALIGTLTNNGGGKYSATFTLSSNPSSVSVKSSLGGSASRAVTVK